MDKSTVPEKWQSPQPYNFGYKIDDGYGNRNYQEEEGECVISNTYMFEYLTRKHKKLEKMRRLTANKNWPCNSMTS